MNKRGVYFFIIDVVIGVLIFLTTVLVISSFFIPRPSLAGIDQNLNILTEDFFTLPISDLPDEVLNFIPEKYQGRADLTVDELLYLFKHNDVYVDNSTDIVEGLISWLPGQFGFNYSTSRTGELYSRSTSLGVTSANADVVVSRAKVTGLDSRDGLILPALTEVSIWR